jgi:hypothetical protein
MHAVLQDGLKLGALKKIIGGESVVRKTYSHGELPFLKTLKPYDGCNPTRLGGKWPSAMRLGADVGITGCRSIAIDDSA